MFGISMSRVMTSGFSALIASRASQRVAGLADDLDLGVGDQDGGDQAAHGGGVVDDEDATEHHGLASRLAV